MKKLLFLSKGLLILTLIFSQGAVVYAEQPNALEGISIFGNRELPKALVIVPWKSPEAGALAGKPVNSLIDEVMEPIDKEVFEREVEYYNAMHSAP